MSKKIIVISIKIMIFSVFLVGSGCMNNAQNINNTGCNYNKRPLISYKDSLYVEKNITSDSFHQYLDNIIFKAGRTYNYKYELLKNTDTFYINNIGLNELKDSITVSSIQIEISDTLYPSYSTFREQSPYYIKYLTSKGDLLMTSYTGSIENYKNNWMHPPVFSAFKSTFSMPWPYVKFDSNIDESYLWSHKISDFWSHDEINKFEGMKSMSFQYTIVSKTEKLNFQGKEIYCWRIKANDQNDKSSEAEFIYNCEYGFMKFIYNFKDGYSLNIIQI